MRNPFKRKPKAPRVIEDGPPYIIGVDFTVGERFTEDLNPSDWLDDIDPYDWPLSNGREHG